MNVVPQHDSGSPVAREVLVVAPEPLPTAPPTDPSQPKAPRSRLWRLWALRLLFVRQMKGWFFNDGCWYIGSMFAHAFVLFSLALITLSIPRASQYLFNNAPTFDAPDMPPAAPVGEVSRFEVGDTPLDPTELNTETLMMSKAESLAGQTAKWFDDSPVFEDEGGGTAVNREGPQLGGLGGFSIKDLPGPAGKGGVGVGTGTGNLPGMGGGGSGFAGRGKGHREALLGSGGGTKASERAVGAALNWIARHQTSHGNWKLDCRGQCKGAPCSGPGLVRSDSAATAMALLPFLAAGQTHKSKGPYQQNIAKGLAWLVKHQSPDGDLSDKCDQPMYAHGIASITMCEAYGMTMDPTLKAPAQKAIAFIEWAQNQSTGGWRYEPHDPLGDTSVFGWQMMAMKSAELAGLAVNSMTLENAHKWLRMVAKGSHLGLYSYQPYRKEQPSMTAVGMLCSQYLGAGRNDPAMREGMQYLLSNLPNNTYGRDVYYWYYATLAMHNIDGPEWDAWNRKIRRVLIESQITDDCCAMGSWDPVKPTLDVYGEKGGRLMMTSFNAMTLEVYYRYLPLFNTDSVVPRLPPPNK